MQGEGERGRDKLISNEFELQCQSGIIKLAFYRVVLMLFISGVLESDVSACPILNECAMIASAAPFGLKKEMGVAGW